MSRILPYSIAANIVLAIAGIILFVQNRTMRVDEQALGALQQYGAFAIYNASPPEVPDGTGTALNADSQGRLITSTTSEAELITPP